MSKKILWVLVLGMVYASTGASFVNNGFSARSEAMGEAFTAVADDLDAFYYNPAGFAWQRGTRMNSYITKVSNLQNDFYAGLGSKWSDFYLAVNLLNSSLSDIPLTEYDGSSVVETGSCFGYSSSAMTFSVALCLGNYFVDWEKVSLGVNFKLLSEKLYNSSASGYGMDLGLMYLFNDNLKLGCSVVNLLEPKITWTGGHRDVVARNFRFGGAYLFDQVFLLAVDLIVDEDQWKNSLGLEYLLNDYLSLRAGVSKIYYSIGMGISFNSFNFDYSFSQPYDDLQEATHKFAVGYFWQDRLQQTIVENNYSEDILDNVYETVTKNTKPEAEEIQEVPYVIDKVGTNYIVDNKDNFKLIKKTILLANSKVKGFYKIENLGNELMDIKITVKVLDGQKLIGEKSLEYKLPAGQQNVYAVIIDLDKVALEYKVKSFIQVNGTKTESYLDYLFE